MIKEGFPAGPLFSQLIRLYLACNKHGERRNALPWEAREPREW